MHRVLVYRVEPDAAARRARQPGARVVEPRRRETMEEGCLSLPASTWTSSGRCTSASARWTSAAREQVIEASGLEARVIQHEMDHLDGVLILDRTSRDQRKQAMRTLREQAERAAGASPLSAAGAAVRTVYLGTSAFAAAVLERLAGEPPPAGARRSRAPTGPRGPGPQAGGAAGRRARARARPRRRPARGPARAREPPSGSPAIAPDVLVRLRLRRPHARAAAVRLRGAQRRTRRCCRAGAAPRPIERAIMAGDTETGVSIMRLTEGLDSGPVCLQAGRADPGPTTTYGTLAAAAGASSAATCWCGRSTSARPFVEQDDAAATYAAKIEPADRIARPARAPGELERVVRALRPHIGARVALPGGAFLGVLAAQVSEGRRTARRAACAPTGTGCCSTAPAERWSCSRSSPPEGGRWPPRTGSAGGRTWADGLRRPACRGSDAADGSWPPASSAGCAGGVGSGGADSAGAGGSAGARRLRGRGRGGRGPARRAAQAGRGRAAPRWRARRGRGGGRARKPRGGRPACARARTGRRSPGRAGRRRTGRRCHGRGRRGGCRRSRRPPRRAGCGRTSRRPPGGAGHGRRDHGGRGRRGRRSTGRARRPRRRRRARGRRPRRLTGRTARRTRRRLPRRPRSLGRVARARLAGGAGPVGGARPAGRLGHSALARGPRGGGDVGLRTGSTFRVDRSLRDLRWAQRRGRRRGRGQRRRGLGDGGVRRGRLAVAARVRGHLAAGRRHVGVGARGVGILVRGRGRHRVGRGGARARRDLGAVGDPVPVAVGQDRVRPDADLLGVGDAVGVGVGGRVARAGPARVRVDGVGPDLLLGAVVEAVAVGIIVGVRARRRRRSPRPRAWSWRGSPRCCAGRRRRSRRRRRSARRRCCRSRPGSC